MVSEPSAFGRSVELCELHRLDQLEPLFPVFFLDGFFGFFFIRATCAVCFATSAAALGFDLLVGTTCAGLTASPAAASMSVASHEPADPQQTRHAQSGNDFFALFEFHRCLLTLTMKSNHPPDNGWGFFCNNG